MMLKRTLYHFHFCCGLGGGAKGFNRARPRVGNVEAHWECIGGIDVDPSALRDFGKLAGVPGTQLDLFTRDQYIRFHGDASNWSLEHAAGFAARGYVPWPKGYIDRCSRPVALAELLNHRQALRSVGLRLPKIVRPRIRRYTVNCAGCGRFLGEHQVYGDCPNCGENNAP